MTSARRARDVREMMCLYGDYRRRSRRSFALPTGVALIAGKNGLNCGA